MRLVVIALILLEAWVIPHPLAAGGLAVAIAIGGCLVSMLREGAKK